MVGREEGSGDYREDLSWLRGTSESATMRKARAGVPWCCNQILAPGTRATEGGPCDCFAAEALTEGELDESWRRIAVLMVCKKDPSPGEVLPYRLVYGIAAERDCEPEVVNDQS